MSSCTFKKKNIEANSNGNSHHMTIWARIKTHNASFTEKKKLKYLGLFKSEISMFPKHWIKIPQHTMFSIKISYKRTHLKAYYRFIILNLLGTHNIVQICTSAGFVFVFSSWNRACAWTTKRDIRLFLFTSTAISE